MEFLEAIIGRRSVRAFKEQSVADQTIEKLIEAATWAPSAECSTLGIRYCQEPRNQEKTVRSCIEPEFSGTGSRLDNRVRERNQIFATLRNERSNSVLHSRYSGRHPEHSSNRILNGLRHVLGRGF